MLVWYNIEAACPMCSHRLRLRELGGGFALGQDSDLLVRMEGRHVVQAAVHTCLRCRYSGYPEDFGTTVERPLARKFLSEVAPELGGGAGKLTTTPLPDLQYYWAYRCAAFLERPDGELGQRLLRAYWCLRLPPSSELPAPDAEERRRLYLVGAIHHLRQDQRTNSSPVGFYILGELNRRNGDFPTAVGFFKRFLDSSASEGAGAGGSAPRYLRLAAIKLLRAAEHGDRRERTMEEIVYAT